jgi:hypothetical protein
MEPATTVGNGTGQRETTPFEANGTLTRRSGRDDDGAEFRHRGAEMNDAARFAWVIRINKIGGGAMLGLVALCGWLVLIGALPADGSFVVRVVFGLVLALIMFRTAYLARRERDDPSGADRRFQQEALTMSAIVVLVSFAVVVGLIAWGLTR